MMLLPGSEIEVERETGMGEVRVKAEKRSNKNEKSKLSGQGKSLVKQQYLKFTTTRKFYIS
jgi:hypothetical protein